jgi:hypothetical protein
MRRRRSVWLLTAALIALSGVLEAQTVNATISGFTTDPSGAVVPGARIIATNVLTGLKAEAVAAGDGCYVLTLLPVGRYILWLSKSGVSKLKMWKSLFWS